VAFFLDAFPARDGADDGPLRRATRREMQRAWNPAGVVATRCAECDTPRAVADGYAAGLRAQDDAHVGHVVLHSGGLPGFGSNMRWLPERGLGLVSLGNASYAPMSARNRAAFDALAHRGRLPPERPQPVPAELERAAHALVALLGDWDDTSADALFADNVALDDTYERRRHDAAELVARTGVLRVDTVTADDRAQATVTAVGERAGATVELQLHPGLPPRVQWYEATVVDGPRSA
jgi:CubicO group peptidase (beta-lactamase class C family)